MKNINKKLFVMFSTFFILNGCTEKFEFGTGNSTKTGTGNDSIVRGPSGTGSGGGVIIVENGGDVAADTKYELYLEEDGFKEKLQSGTTDSEGKIQLSESKLSAERIRKLQNGSLNIIVEVYNGSEKTAASGRIIVRTDSGNSSIDLG